MEKNIPLYGDGVHDDTAAIQSLLDRRGLILLPCGTYLISRPLIIHDDTHLRLAPSAVLRLADGANCSILDNDGLYERRTNRNITIEGGIWDGNNSAQTREFIADENQPCDYDKYISNSLTVLMIRFVHTDHLTVKNITFKNPTSYSIHIADAKYFTVENIYLDHDLSKPNMDGVHIQGPARFGTVRNIYGNANDDHVALCANGTVRSEVTRGPIEDVDIDGVYCDNGYTGVRLLSFGDPIRNISVRNIHGAFRYYAVSLTHHYPLREGRDILLENIHISDVYASKTLLSDERTIAERDALIWLENDISCRNVCIENLYRTEQDENTTAPAVRIGKRVTGENITLRNICQNFAGDEAAVQENGSEETACVKVL